MPQWSRECRRTNKILDKSCVLRSPVSCVLDCTEFNSASSTNKELTDIVNWAMRFVLAHSWYQVNILPSYPILQICEGGHYVAVQYQKQMDNRVSSVPSEIYHGIKYIKSQYSTLSLLWPQMLAVTETRLLALLLRDHSSCRCTQMQCSESSHSHLSRGSTLQNNRCDKIALWNSTSNYLSQYHSFVLMWYIYLVHYP